MSRMRANSTMLVVLVMLAVGLTAQADGLGFTASVGLEVSYTPVPPASYNIGTELNLGIDISGFSFSSVTGFDLTGFQYEWVDMKLDLGAVSIAEDLRFEPIFAWNELSLDIGIVGIELGIDWILANIGSVQTPSYSMGAVIELSSGIVCGFSITSLTGFGAVDLVNVLGGAEAPFSYELLSLYHHIAGLCVEDDRLDVTIVSGFYFEEELVRLAVDFQGLIASTTTWFDYAGLSKMLFELGYRFDEPALSFLTSMTLDGSFAITGLGFILDLAINGVQFTSDTQFAEATVPAPIPILFSGQRFALGVNICGVTVCTQTDFDDTFLFEQQIVALEASIDPVSLVSVTTFDALGFASQCVRAEVVFTGASLYTKAEFNFSGVQNVSFGFRAGFGATLDPCCVE